ncbi:MAG: hypothetical protein EBV45_00745, partial [Chloroflexi bacterium]|nr:hypothetical protein [Chloroflexota bacterium]
ADDFFEARIVFDDGCRATVGKCDFAYLSPPKWLIYGTAATLRHDNDACIVETATTSLRVKEGDVSRETSSEISTRQYGTDHRCW